LISRYQDWSGRTEKFFESKLENTLPQDESGVLVGILFGERSGITPELQREFAATGTAHILATAGLHVGILALCLSLLFETLPLPRKLAAVIIIVLLWFFAALAGDRPAVVRAVAAATIFFGGRLFGRVPDAPTTITTAALGILLIEPPTLFDSDFQLSFVTVTGLALFMHCWKSIIKPWITLVRHAGAQRLTVLFSELAGFSTIAQLSAAPLVAYYFSQFSLLSLPVNLVVVPLLFLVIPISVIVLLLLLVMPTVGTFAACFMLHPLLWLILRTVGWFSSLPFCSLAVPMPPVYVIVLIYALLFGCGLYLGKEKKSLRKNTLTVGEAS
jgi:competence protein ComEC